jgi:hypothetical protein
MDLTNQSIAQACRCGIPLLNSVSRIALAALSVGLAVGVNLPREARAGSAINPSQTSTYVLGKINPITFGAATNINVASRVGVYGGLSASWNVSNYGSIEGLAQGIHLASSGGVVTNWGTIGATGATGVGVLMSGGTVTNQSGGAITGYVGIYMGGSGGAVTNSGSITGLVSAAIVTSGSINNKSGGTMSMSSAVSALTAYVGHGGSVTNAGKITNGGYGSAAVAIGGGGTVTNSGTISASNTFEAAVYVTNGGTVTNSGTLTVTGLSSTGVYFINGGALLNSGTVSGSGNKDFGVVMPKGGSVTNSGTIAVTAAGSIGIGANSASTVNNQSTGTISGVNGGVVIRGGAGSVTNAGAIRASSNYGVGVLGGGTVSNTGTITGGGLGVYIGGGSASSNSVTNSGQIVGAGTNATGVRLGSGGTLTNQSGGTISGPGVGVFINGASSSVVNAGDVYGTAASGTGAVLMGGGSVTNTGTISGGGVGLFVVGGPGSATNSGVILGANQEGVAFAGGGAVNNKSGGSIAGAVFGVYLGGGSGATNTVTNVGTISATAANGIGVMLASGGTLTNQTGGTISGASAGVSIRGAGSVINSGEIEGTAASGNGVVLAGAGTVTNTGTITGGHSGVYVRGGGAVTNAGTISGGFASVAFAGSGTNTLTLQAGSALTGGAYGSTAAGATNALILQGQGTANNNFGAFNTLNATASGLWTLGGVSKFGDAMVSTGTLAVTGALTSKTLEIEASAQFTDSGDVKVYGAVTNSGNLTINGVTMEVAGAGGTFTQLAGGTTTLLNGGVLDPANIRIERGVFSGAGSLVGDVTVTGGAIEPGGGPGGSLKFLGDYSQTGGVIVFKVDAAGNGGFLETTLDFDPSFAIGLSDTTFVFDFGRGANASEFIADGLLNLNTFLGLSDGGAFCAKFDCGTVLRNIHFADNLPGFAITGFDAATGLMSAQAAPEPSAWALILTGFLGLGGLRVWRRGNWRDERSAPSQVSWPVGGESGEKALFSPED